MGQSCLCPARIETYPGQLPIAAPTPRPPPASSSQEQREPTLGTALCPPGPSPLLKSSCQYLTQTVAASGDGVFEEVRKVNQGREGGLNPSD